MDNALAAIHQQVMWHRLIAVVEEQAQTILRTAFGAVVREAGDLSAGVYDPEGRMLAQAVTGTPGHVNTMARAVAHFLTRFERDALRPGDVLVTNDPWMGTGHLFDFVVVTPVLLNESLIAWFASTCHVTDVGGRGFSAEARSVFEEGIQVPHTFLRRAGTFDPTLELLIKANSRNPIECWGDILSLVAANDTGANRLLAMLSEFGLEDLNELGAMIRLRSRAAMLERLSALPSGKYASEMTIDGFDAPLTLKATMRIADDSIQVDFAGSSPASPFGINSPLCYTEAYTCFGIKCLIAPDVPNNSGSLSVFEVTAPAGSAVHPLKPSPVTARHVIGQMLPDLAFGCLTEALPGKVPAESAGSIWVLPVADDGEGPTFNAMNVGIGGIGARPGKDGLACTAFPSGVGSIPLEITETQTPLVFWSKQLTVDSGGAGQYRGGLGQTLEIAHVDQLPWTLSAATWDRLNYPARGRDGGHDGGTGAALRDDGQPLAGKTVHRIDSGLRAVLTLPGGGGLGDPLQRERAAVAADLAAGYISPTAAASLYGYTTDDLEAQ